MENKELKIKVLSQSPLYTMLSSHTIFDLPNHISKEEIYLLIDISGYKLSWGVMPKGQRPACKFKALLLPL